MINNIYIKLNSNLIKIDEKNDKNKILKEYERNLMYIMDLLGSGITDNIQLDKLGKYLFGDKFIGTYSSDELPKNIKNENCFILNNK